MMRKTVCSGVLAISLLVPVMASAQTPAPPAPTTDQILVVRPSQLLAIAAGVVAGAVVLQAAIPTRLGLLAGAVVGGYLGNLWYGGGQLELHVATPKT